MFFPGVSYHHHHDAPEAAPYDDRDHSLVVLLTFAIFFSFVVLYLFAGVVWASAATACAVALSFCYLNARRRAALRRAAAAGVALRLARQALSIGRMDVNDAPVDMSTIPAFTYKRERGGGSDAAGGSAGWAQCVICLGLVQVGEVVRRLPACKHLFHAGCIDAWLRSHSTCPICRAAVELTDGRSEPPV